jgi:hypothetical protein
MLDVKSHLRKRVHIGHRVHGLAVRIDRQNSRGMYLWMAFLSTIFFGFFSDTVVRAILRNLHDWLYISPLLLLGLTCYAVALALAAWGAFGVEELTVEQGELRWTRRVLRWSRTREIAASNITSVRAVLPWYGLDNSVELIADGKQRRIGDKLLQEEASELAHRLRQALRVSG